jgi:hypothetical protein
MPPAYRKFRSRPVLLKKRNSNLDKSARAALNWKNDTSTDVACGELVLAKLGEGHVLSLGSASSRRKEADPRMSSQGCT